MVKIDERFVDHNQLKDAWQRTLPTVMNPSDQSEVMADEADPKALRIHIRAAGHMMYTFDNMRTGAA